MKVTMGFHGGGGKKVKKNKKNNMIFAVVYHGNKQCCSVFFLQLLSDCISLFIFSDLLDVLQSRGLFRKTFLCKKGT